jgi:uncharacterized repeat protein (TIGR03806 family)
MNMRRPTVLFAFAVLLAALANRSPIQAAGVSEPPYGLETRPIAKPYLSMPELATGKFPPLLSQTGAFEDVRTLAPNRALIPYNLVLAFWSDGAVKSRWISLPAGKVSYSRTDEWGFPPGTVFLKHFDLPVDDTNPSIKRRLETRLLVRGRDGKVYGVTYKWRPDNSDAELLTTDVTENITIKTAGGTRTQTWYYPSRKDCLTCHTANAGGVLGVKTRQMNREIAYPSGVTDNQLRAWNHVGIFDTPVPEPDRKSLPTLAAATDMSRTLEDRARSYLDANCAQCHRPGGTVANFDARYSTPLARQGLINGPVVIDENIDRSRVIAPKDIWRSILFMRADTNDAIRMPPLARMTIDTVGVDLLQQWIDSMPGPPVLPPPSISPPGGSFDKALLVTLQEAESGAVIHYTTDGSEPTTTDPVYSSPLKVTEAQVVRARAYKPGFTRSITAQQVFVPSN